MLHEVIERSLA